MSEDRRPGILFLEALPTLAGGQTVLVNLIPALRELYRLAALLPGEGALANALRAAGVTCFFAPVGRYSLMRKSLRDVVVYAARTPLLAWRTARLIRRWGADLVYANSGPTFLWGTLAAQFTGRPIVWHHHNLLADGKTLRLVQAAAHLPAVRRILCVSAAAQAQFPSAAAKTVVIRNGVDTQKFQPDPAARTRVRAELGIPAAAAVVGMVGDLIPLKGQDSLLAALPGLAAEFPNLWTILVGDVRTDDAASAQYAARLRTLTPAQVMLVGRRGDLPAVLNAFDLLVVASERETGPLVLLEALATGVPVISTPVGYAPDLLPSDALFPVGDMGALTARLARWLGDPVRLRAAGARARSLACTESSIEQMRRQVATELAALLQPPVVTEGM
jgi:glycosyltransferase involved in cell wall biosynthesis